MDETINEIKEENLEQEKTEVEQVEVEKPSEPDPRLVAAINETANVMLNLITIQQQVNNKVNEKLEKSITWQEYVTAYNVELYELINAIGIWKWWKQHNQPNKEDVLDELADCFAFILSAMSVTGDENRVHEICNAFASRYWEIKLSIQMGDKEADVKQICYLIGSASELHDTEHLNTLDSFVLAILMVERLFDTDWDDFIYYYKKKSKVNIKRQEENY